MFHRIPISFRVGLVMLSFAVPLAVQQYFITAGINSDIEFSLKEKYGNEYQRPLEDLLRSIPEHEELTQRHLRGEQLGDSRSTKQVEIDRAFDSLQAVDARLSSILQFTQEGLAQRKRDHFRVQLVKPEWEELKNARSTDAAECGKQHAHLVLDIRTMITHAGDTSNLILDPDLDSYYLMDMTLLALPQTQERLAMIMKYGEEILARKALTPKERSQFKTYGVLLQESDFSRVAGDVQTVLTEDPNFYGISDSLQQKLPPAFEEYKRATESLIHLIEQIADSDTLGREASEFLSVAQKARSASFSLWHAAVTELDILLQKRIDYYRDQRRVALTSSGIALAFSILFSVLLIHSIIHSIRDPLRRVVKVLHASSDQVNTSVDQISQTSLSLADAANRQAALVEETSASLEEMAGMTKRNAQNAKSAKEFAGQARMAADTGAQNMKEMVDAMGAIKASSNSISKIIKIIDEIAFQTNILALNAAVEAARAGESGMGFAVVADEVRNLAQRSAQASKETASMIENSLARSEGGVRISDKVSQNFQEIFVKAQKVDELVAEISLASNEQTQGIDQINSAVSQVDQVTQSNSAGAEETSSAAQELSAQSKDLIHAIHVLLQLVGEKTAPSNEKSASSLSSQKSSTHSLASVQISQATPRRQKNLSFVKSSMEK